MSSNNNQREPDIPADVIEDTERNKIKKKCIDLPYIIITLVFWVIYIVIAKMSSANANEILLYPTDEDNRPCGYGGLADYDKLYYSNVTGNYFNMYNSRLCVSECPVFYNGLLKCAPTEKNPKCTLLKINYYNSTQVSNFCLPLNYTLNNLEPKGITYDHVYAYIINNKIFSFKIGLHFAYFYLITFFVITFIMTFMFIICKYPYVLVIAFYLSTFLCVAYFSFNILYFFNVEILTKTQIKIGSWCFCAFFSLGCVTFFMDNNGNYYDSIFDITQNSSLWRNHYLISSIVSMIMLIYYSIIYWFTYSIIINLVLSISSFERTTPLIIIELIYVIFFISFTVAFLSSMTKLIYTYYAYNTSILKNNNSLKNLFLAFLFVFRYNLGTSTRLSLFSIINQFNYNNIRNPNRREYYGSLVQFGDHKKSISVFNRQYVRIGLFTIISMLTLLYTFVLGQLLPSSFYIYLIWAGLCFPFINWILSFPSSFNNIMNNLNEVQLTSPTNNLTSAQLPTHLEESENETITETHIELSSLPSE